MTVSKSEAPAAAGDIFSRWLEKFGTALESGDTTQAAALFVPDGYWKDILSFTWAHKTFAGADQIEAALTEALEDTQPTALRIAADRERPRLVKRSARFVIEGYFDFDTKVGVGTGFVRILLNEADPSNSLAWLLLTTLQELRGSEEKTGERRPTGVDYSHNFAGDNWLDQRIKDQEYSDRDPDVLIIGGGQAGLTVAARLGQMGVDALIIEKNPRIGDNWRNRYHSLTLHNQVWANSLPYMPFPPTWPTFVPKDKLAGWLEGYAEFMELNAWTGTEFLGGSYDDVAQMWTARIKKSDGAERTVRAPHLVLANGGTSGVAKVPSLPGLKDFSGEVIHSSQFTSGIPYQGKRAIVVGTGNSGHDVAQDLYSNGAAQVTMIQRSPTCVVSLVPSGTMVYSLYSEGPSPDDIDLITAAIPYPILKETYQWVTKKTCELDKDLLDGLHAVGFETDFEPDNTGFHMKFLRTGGGYYINVGCSDLLIEGKIGLTQARDMEHFTSTGLQLKDGTTIESDVVVLATGFENQQEGVRRLLGDDVADKVGPIWGFDEDYGMRNMWKQTDQEGFWVVGGPLIDCRLHSKFLALQIKAALDGILPRKTPSNQSADAALV